MEKISGGGAPSITTNAGGSFSMEESRPVEIRSLRSEPGLSDNSSFEDRVDPEKTAVEIENVEDLALIEEELGSKDSISANSRFAEEVLEVAREDGEDAALEMLAAEEGEGELIVDGENIDDTESPEDGEVKGEMDIFKDELADLHERIQQIEVTRREMHDKATAEVYKNQTETMQELIDRIRELIELEEEKKKEEKKNPIQVLLEILLSMAQFVVNEMTDYKKEEGNARVENKAA